MWNSNYSETKAADGDKVGKAVFWQVGVSRETQRRFKRTFRHTLENSTPRKAYDAFIHRFTTDNDFRNRLFVEHGWPAEADWLANQDVARKESERDVTFQFLFDYWRAHASTEWSAQYTKLVDSFWKQLKGTLAGMRMTEVTKVMMAGLDARLVKGGNKRSTVNRKLQIVMRVLNYGWKHDLIEVNPLAKFRLPPDPRPKNDFWSEDEAAHFLAVAERRYPPGSPRRWVYIAYLTALNTGVRANELWALKPRNMRPDSQTLWLTHQWCPTTKEFKRLKSKDEGQGRAVPMNDLLCRELTMLQRARGLGPDDLFFGVDESDPWYRVWCKPGARPVDHTNFRKRAWATDLRTSANRQIRFHDLRHSAATLMRKSGASRDEVCSILGHSDSETTARYDHAADESATQVASRFVLQPKRALTVVSGESPGADAG